MNLIRKSLVIVLELDPLLCARMTTCGLSPRSLRVLGKPLRITPCKGGVIFDGCVFTHSGDLERELLWRADLSDETAGVCGGESTATGRWRMDRAAFFRAASALVRLYRGALWPLEADEC